MRVYYVLMWLLMTVPALCQSAWDDASKYYRTDPPKAIAILESSIHSVSGSEQAKTLYALSYIYHENDLSPENALEHGVMALRQYYRLGDKPAIERCLRHLSLIHLKAKNFRESIEYSELALAASPDAARKAQNEHNLGLAYEYLKSPKKALTHLMNALNYYLGVGDEEKICELTIEVGLVYYYAGDYSFSIVKYQDAVDLAEHWGLDEWKARALNNIGNAYMKMHEKEKAIPYLKESLNMKAELGVRLQLTSANMVTKYFMESKRYDSANHYNRMALASFVDQRDLAEYYDALGHKISIARATGHLDTAFHYLDLQTRLVNENLVMRAKLQTEHERVRLQLVEEQKRAEYLAAEKERLERRKIWFIFGGLLLTLLMAIGTYFYLVWRARRTDMDGILKFLPPAPAYRVKLLKDELEETRLTLKQSLDKH